MGENWGSKSGMGKSVKQGQLNLLGSMTNQYLSIHKKVTSFAMQSYISSWNGFGSTKFEQSFQYGPICTTEFNGWTLHSNK